MDKQQNQMKRWLVILAALFAATLAVLLLFLTHTWELPRPHRGEKIKTEGVVEKQEGSVALTGFGSIAFEADIRQQELTIPNAPENTCLIRVTLTLADGTVLWTSEEVKPGYYSTPVYLNEPLPAGVYEGVHLKYECFSDDEAHAQLNGAESVLTLYVQ